MRTRRHTYADNANMHADLARGTYSSARVLVSARVWLHPKETGQLPGGVRTNWVITEEPQISKHMVDVGGLFQWKFCGMCQ